MSREPDESFNEWLSREDPDPDAIYESWRDRQAELAEEMGPWRHLMAKRSYVNLEDEG